MLVLVVVHIFLLFFISPNFDILALRGLLSNYFDLFAELIDFVGPFIGLTGFVS